MIARKPTDKNALVTRPIGGLLSKATTLERYDERRLMLRKHVRRHAASYAISGIHSGDKSKEHLVAGLKVWPLTHFFMFPFCKK